jgi:hypothetical protein
MSTKIFKAVKDVLNEENVIMKDDKAIILHESDTSITINIEKETGFDPNDKDYTVTIPKTTFDSTFKEEPNIEKVDTMATDNNVTDNSTKTNTTSEPTAPAEEVKPTEEKPVDNSFVDPNTEKDKKKMLTQEIERIRNLLAKDSQERSTVSEAVKEKSNKRIEELKLSEEEKFSVKSLVENEIKKVVSTIDSKEISEALKNKIKLNLQTFLDTQIKVLSETFEDRLKLKVFEMEQAKEKEIYEFVKSEKKKIDEHIDYVSREIMMEMKNSFVDEAIVNESIAYKEDLKKLQDKFKRLNETVSNLKNSLNKVTVEKNKSLQENNTLKKRIDHISNKYTEVVKDGLTRDITESIKDPKAVQLIEKYASTIETDNYEQFYKALKEYAVGILKESKKAKLKLNQPLLKENRERNLNTDSTSLYENISPKNRVDEEVIEEEEIDEEVALYTGALKNF